VVLRSQTGCRRPWGMAPLWAALGAIALGGALMAQAPQAVAQLQRAGPLGGRAPDAATLARSSSSGHLRILEPAVGQELRPGELRLRVAQPPAGGRTAEILVSWNSDPSGVTPVESCQVPLQQLVAGVLAPPQITRGREGRFTIQARVIEPYQGALSAPVGIRIGAGPSHPSQGLLRTPDREPGVMRRPTAAQVGDFACSG